MGMLFGITQGRSLVASAELGVADALANGPLEVGALAAAVQVNAGYLFRLMRALESIGVFQQVSPGVFANTPLSDCLRSDAPGSQRAFARLFAPGMGLWDGYGELLDSVRTGRTTLFDKWGYDFWENLRRDGTKAEIFNESMRSMTASMTPAVTGGYDWSRFATVADIAGGIGTQLVDILNRFPECSGVLFDQPEVVAAAIPHERMRVVGGSFFDEVPIVADAYILRNIIHDWNDEHSLKILQH